MEEIVTIDGRQFRLNTDRPLTAQEKAEVIADIRKQTGCGCGTRGAIASMGNDWQYGGKISSMAVTCTPGTKNVGSTVSFTATPTGGTAPYDVRFWKKVDASAPTQGTITTPTHLATPEATLVTASYLVLEADVTASIGDGTAVFATGVSLTDGSPTFVAGGAHALAAGSIRFYATTIDSCPTGKLTCVEECDVPITCVAPTCNFVVT